jgi:hypothetical protein
MDGSQHCTHGPVARWVQWGRIPGIPYDGIGANAEVRVDDLRELAHATSGSFDAVLACDNGIPRLLSDGEILQAFQNCYRCLAFLAVQVWEWDGNQYDLRIYLTREPPHRKCGAPRQRTFSTRLLGTSCGYASLILMAGCEKPCARNSILRKMQLGCRASCAGTGAMNSGFSEFMGSIRRSTRRCCPRQRTDAEAVATMLLLIRRGSFGSRGSDR